MFFIWYNKRVKFFKWVFRVLLLFLVITIILVVLSESGGLRRYKINFVDRFMPSISYQKLRDNFENNKVWNVSNDKYLSEINFARYAAFNHKIGVYMQNDFPLKSIQKNTLKKIDSDGIIVDGNNKLLGYVDNLYPVKFNNKIMRLAREYANSGAVDSENLVHSPNNPNFSGVGASDSNPIFTRWTIDDYTQVKRESIAYGYNSVHEVVRGWLNEDDNIEQDTTKVLGHRLHVLDVSKNSEFGALARSKSSGWVYHSGTVFNKNWPIVGACDFLTKDKDSFTLKTVIDNYVYTYYPIQNKILKFNKYTCPGVEIKAFYPGDLKNEIQPGSEIDKTKKYILFIQTPQQGYVLKNANNVEIIRVKIWGK